MTKRAMSEVLGVTKRDLPAAGRKGDERVAREALAMAGLPKKEAAAVAPVAVAVAIGKEVGREDGRTAIVKRRVRNPRVLIAEMDGKEIVVRVKNSQKFTRGFVIPVVPFHGNTWAVGRAEPRWPGKW